MRLCQFVLLSAAICAPACVCAQGGVKTEISADLIIPQPPPSAPPAEWRDAAGRKAFSLQVAGAVLHGFHYAGADAKAPEVLFFNGNGMTILHTDRFYRAPAALGPSVTVYDYRGYGFSRGTASLINFREDGLRAYDALVKTAPGGRVVVYGASMGTAVAAYVASQRPLAGLVLGMPIASAEEELPVYGQLVGFTPTQLAMTTPSAEASSIFGETALVKRSNAPLLVLGGSDDNVVPVQQAREVFAASPSAKKKIVVVPGAGHNDVILSSAAMMSVSEMLTQLQ